MGPSFCFWMILALVYAAYNITSWGLYTDMGAKDSGGRIYTVLGSKVGPSFCFWTILALVYAVCNVLVSGLGFGV